MEVRRFEIEGLLEIEPRVFGDHRGWFYESFNLSRFTEQGLPTHFVQDNVSFSQKGTLRGLHYQVKHQQAKLVSVLQGEVFDVAVDLRPGSATFGQSQHVVLSGLRHNMFYVPEGFAHGFQVLSDQALFFYKCSDFYHPEDESGIIWNDADLGIAWPLADQPILSEKDACLKPFKAAVLPQPLPSKD